MKIQTLTARASGLTLSALLLLGVSGCASMGQTERGAAVGATAGAAVGGLIGAAAGSTAKGAIIGAAVGGVGGAVIGRRMDRQAEELENELENATVERVGEGIQITFESGILFDFDSDRLRPAAMENLQSLRASLAEYPGTELLVVGHTDDVGSEAYNQALSERRARAAVDYLVSVGVPSERLTVAGRGEMEPVATNETDAGRQENRRVEVAIFASEEYQAEIRRQYGGGGGGTLR